MKKALVLFSGGKDSFLSTLLYLEKGYKVYLVSYDNGFELNCKNVLVGAKRIQKKYGSDKVEIIGIKKIDSIWRELICNLYNYDTDYIKNNFGNITISQINCLICRLSMYISSIIIAKQNKINVVVDGARKCQLFAIEQEELINEFIKLFKKYNLEISYPILNELNDFSIKNKILAYGFVPKMNEMQCLIGMPINNKIQNEIIDSCINILNKELLKKIDEIIKNYKDIEFEKEYL